MWPVHLYGKKFVFSITTWYVIHMLKVQCHYASHSNETCRLFHYLFVQKLGRYLLFACRPNITEQRDNGTIHMFHVYKLPWEA